MSPAEIPVAALPPEVTTDRLEALEDEAEGYVGPEGLHLIVDLAQTTFICSGGLGMLVKISKRLHERGGALALAAAQPPVVRLLRVVGLEGVLPHFASVEAASGFLRESRGARTA